ncbi:hypothetical protein HHI36_015294 [Cryptolaemus montrouzieri]|uniref:Uncharacterized protein n=1 Tax=Cryptolaemus montrouzieri TaxID=559131 RepID=A0ABD2N562_9CUCU
MEEGGNSRSTTMGVLCGRTGLLIIMTGYAVFGALIFKAIESSESTNATPIVVQKSREDCLKELWLITALGSERGDLSSKLRS